MLKAVAGGDNVLKHMKIHSNASCILLMCLLLAALAEWWKWLLRGCCQFMVSGLSFPPRVDPMGSPGCSEIRAALRKLFRAWLLLLLACPLCSPCSSVWAASAGWKEICKMKEKFRKNRLGTTVSWGICGWSYCNDVQRLQSPPLIVLSSNSFIRSLCQEQGSD